MQTRRCSHASISGESVPTDPAASLTETYTVASGLVSHTGSVDQPPAIRGWEEDNGWSFNPEEELATVG